MPNWVYNNVRVNGTKEQILEMFNYGLKQDGKEPMTSPDNVINLKLTMESYIPMPQTYRDYDTTNKMPNRNAINWSTDEPMFNSDEEYQQYVENYKKAQTEQLEKYGVVGWYNWRCRNLGCKWDAEFEFGEFKKGQRDDEWTTWFNLHTPWSIPLPFYDKISKLFPELEFNISCEEEFEAFAGSFKLKNGVILTNDMKWSYEEVQKAKDEEEEIECLD